MKKDEFLCPVCGEAMKKGNVQIRGTLASSLLFGHSFQCLWFGKERILTPESECDAMRCSLCNITILLHENSSHSP
jgi:predicted RNA-binding Zn-ribbon protein involved in translation (DUF1610 family)